MARKLFSFSSSIVLLIVIVLGPSLSGLAEQGVFQTYLPISKNEKPRTLSICLGQEPDSLYLYGSNWLATRQILQAIYDGPMENNSFAYQPVILSKIPNLADGDAVIEPVDVQQGDAVVDDAGNPNTLSAGLVVRPAGCRNTSCAITYDGQSPLQMDHMLVTFELLPGIHWSDGAHLTALDSVYSFALAADPDTPVSKYTIDRTSSYSALDDVTTVWTGLPGFLDNLYQTNFWSPMPEHAWGDYTALQLLTADISTKKPVGWGPYVIDSWSPGVQLSLDRNPLYFRGDENLPRFTNLIFKFLSGDANEAIAAVLSGECDLIDETINLEPQAEILLSLQGAGLLSAEFGLSGTWEHADFNIQPVESIINTGEFAGWDTDGNGYGPYDDVRLRRAIAMCMDRQGVVDTALYGQSIVLDTYLLPNHPLFNSLATHWDYDPGAGGALLDEIGWLDSDGNPDTPRVAQGVLGVPDGTSLIFNYESTNATLRQQVTQILAQSLAGCGIQANIWLHTAGEWFAPGPDGRLNGRKYDLGEFAWLSGVIPPCNLYLSTNVPGPNNGWSGQNNTGFHSLEYDIACNTQLAALPGEPDYAVGALEAQRILADQLPTVPLFPRLRLAATCPDFYNFSMDSSALSDLWNIENFDYGEGCGQ